MSTGDTSMQSWFKDTGYRIIRGRDEFHVLHKDDDFYKWVVAIFKLKALPLTIVSMNITVDDAFCILVDESGI